MASPAPTLIRWFDELGMADVPEVGGKNANLGELTRRLGPLGVPVPPGFALTATAYRRFLTDNRLAGPLADALSRVDPANVEDLERAAARARALVAAGRLPDDLVEATRLAYRKLAARCGGAAPAVAVRSSATAEDLPGASFAGAHETFLDVVGEESLLEAVAGCYASLFTARAVRYREDRGFEHAAVALSVGVQLMVDASSGASGVIFTLDPESGFRDVVKIDAIWGLGENIVQGRVSPDEILVHKPTLAAGFRPILRRKIGAKEQRLVADPTTGGHVNLTVAEAERRLACLSDDEALTLARWAVAIEDHYSEARGEPTPMDIEFAKDGRTGQLFVVQARPETVHAARVAEPLLTVYELTGTGTVAVEGLAVGDRVATGPVRVIDDPKAISSLLPGEVLVTSSTDPDWEPIMRTAAAIVTDRGGRTSHAAIVARELGIPAVVGTTDATGRLHDGQVVTVSCAEGENGRVYEGSVPFLVKPIDAASLPATRTHIYSNVGQPEQAFKAAQLPNDGVGLARMEFVFAGWVKVHPLALTRYEQLGDDDRRAIDALTAGYEDRAEYFVDTLSQGIAILAAAFWPKPVILRFSDFKTNEYAHLVGGAGFEPVEENPMLGWRGASRYYHPDYREAFLLEVAAVRRVREVMGLTNLAVMVPFCRTPAEGARVLDVMAEGGLVRGRGGLAVYVMAEIPSNVILVEQFAALFDGFSIGSNDLTQLLLGVDRDSVQVASLFDERNDAVRWACAELIRRAHACGATVGICGQAPSDYPDFAAFLVEAGIDSISLNPDAVARTRRRVAEVEAALHRR